MNVIIIASAAGGPPGPAWDTLGGAGYVYIYIYIYIYLHIYIYIYRERERVYI